MTGVEDIKITRAPGSKLSDLSFEDMHFGTHFSDHMFVAEFLDGRWQHPEIKPFQPIMISPACSGVHYGQSIFEGIKAFRNVKTGEIQIFRPFENFKRFNSSARRIMMPEVPKELFIDGMMKLVSLEQKWVPDKHDYSLYIRPFMFATEEFIGVRPAVKYSFMIILSPTGPYYPKPQRIYIEERYVRAAAGGVGYAKCAGNYGAAMLPTEEAKHKGFDQILWTDAKEHKYVQECGTMNAFFIFGETAVTPPLTEKTILDGVTRKSVIYLLKEMGVNVEERNLSIDEVKERYQKGELTEAFGTGTAAVITRIGELSDEKMTLRLDPEKMKYAISIKKKLDAIREGTISDTYGWMVRVEE